VLYQLSYEAEPREPRKWSRHWPVSCQLVLLWMVDL
jgi:hypothetical protein